jgi:hypothetical protein
MSELLTKSEVMRRKGWSYEFFNALHVAPHHIGKRDYFRYYVASTPICSGYAHD